MPNVHCTCTYNYKCTYKQKPPMKIPYIKGNNAHIYSIICIYIVRYVYRAISCYMYACITILLRVIQGVFDCINLLIQLLQFTLKCFQFTSVSFIFRLSLLFISVCVRLEFLCYRALGFVLAQKRHRAEILRDTDKEKQKEIENLLLVEMWVTGGGSTPKKPTISTIYTLYSHCKQTIEECITPASSLCLLILLQLLFHFRCFIFCVCDLQSCLDQLQANVHVQQVVIYMLSYRLAEEVETKNKSTNSS